MNNKNNENNSKHFNVAERQKKNTKIPAIQTLLNLYR